MRKKFGLPLVDPDSIDSGNALLFLLPNSRFSVCVNRIDDWDVMDAELRFDEIQDDDDPRASDLLEYFPDPYVLQWDFTTLGIAPTCAVGRNERFSVTILDARKDGRNLPPQELRDRFLASFSWKLEEN